MYFIETNQLFTKTLQPLVKSFLLGQKGNLFLGRNMFSFKDDPNDLNIPHRDSYLGYDSFRLRSLSLSKKTCEFKSRRILLKDPKC